MKKTTRKLIPALAMLLISAVMMSTASFAWFSMNKNVTVSGMSVTAKSESIYLLIGTASDAATVQSGGLTKETTAVSGQILPAAHDELTTGTDASNATKWYYMIADAPGASTASDQSTKTALTETNFGEYVVTKTVYVTLAKGSNKATNLKVTGCTITAAQSATGSATTIEPVKVLVASPTAVAEMSSTNTSGSDVVLAAEVTDAATIKLDIYIYYDGAHEAVYTNNVANLDGASVELNFSVA